MEMTIRLMKWEHGQFRTILPYGSPNMETAPFLKPQSGSPDLFREAALQQAEITRLTRFCKEVYMEPATTLAP